MTLRQGCADVKLHESCTGSYQCWSDGAPGRIRTCDTGFRRAVLYPLSYEGWDAGSLPRSLGFQTLRSGNPGRMSATRKARNKIDRLAGRAKERIGEATGDARLRDEGRGDQVRSRVRMTGERLRDALRGR
jgi:uncharacterized protein YjbJ (UPF0337 family)